VLGRTLIYPRDLTMSLEERDYEWLGRSGKDRELIRILGALQEEAMGQSYPRQQDSGLYHAIHTKLTRGIADRLRGEDFYREAPSSSSGQTYPDFICIPYPKRPSAGAVPELPEVAVLVVSARAPDTLADERDEREASAGQRSEVFSRERV